MKRKPLPRKGANKSFPSDIVFEDDGGNTVMVITDRKLYIGNPQEAALLLAKRVLTTRTKENINYNEVLSVFVLDDYKLDYSGWAPFPKNWNKFVEEFDRVIKNKAFV